MILSFAISLWWGLELRAADEGHSVAAGRCTPPRVIAAVSGLAWSLLLFFGTTLLHPYH